MKRTELARGTSQLKRTRLAKRSAARQAEDIPWRDVKMAVTARDRGRCQAETLLPEVACGGRIDPHHLDATGRGGKRLTIDGVKSLCRRHHDHVHSHTRQARRLGLLI